MPAKTIKALARSNGRGDQVFAAEAAKQLLAMAEQLYKLKPTEQNAQTIINLRTFIERL